MSSLEARLKELPAEVTDPDFEVCVVARQAMTAPCTWNTETFCVHAYPDSLLVQSCWGGHILRALGAYKNGPGSGYDTQQMSRFYDIASKLGFGPPIIAPSRLYEFNDRHSHAEVLAEFDRRLQQWGEHG